MDGDQYEIYRPFCKRIYRVDRVADLPRVIERAFHLSQAGRPGPVLVDVPMDMFSADLPVGAFSKSPTPMTRPTIDLPTAELVAIALAEAARPVLYVGGGVQAAHAGDELTALAEALEVPVAHSLMGKGSMSDAHPLLLGMTGFWGTPIANEVCRTADLIVAVGTRLAEANSSSWDPTYTFAIPPTRLIHIDIDPAEIGRNFSTELGIVADARNALGMIAAAAKRSARPNRGDLRERIARGRAEFASNWAEQWSSDQYPLRPERILSEVRKALPEDGFLVTDVGWNKNGVAQQFPITVPGTFITPSGLATMGFGPAAALGVKVAQPDRPVLALVGDGAFSNQMSVVATAMEAEIPVVWVVMDNAAFGTIAGLQKAHYDWTFGNLFESEGKEYRCPVCGCGAGMRARGLWCRRRANSAQLCARRWLPEYPAWFTFRWKMRPRPRRGIGISMISIVKASERSRPGWLDCGPSLSRVLPVNSCERWCQT